MRGLFCASVHSLIFDGFLFWKKLKKLDSWLFLLCQGHHVPECLIKICLSLWFWSQVKSSRSGCPGWFHKTKFHNLFWLRLWLFMLFDRIICDNFTNVINNIFKKNHHLFLNRIWDFVKNLVINPRCTVWNSVGTK